MAIQQRGVPTTNAIDTATKSYVDNADTTALNSAKSYTDSATSSLLTSAQVYANSATSTLTNKTLTAPVINSPTGITKADVGLGNVDNTSDSTKNAAAVTLSNKTLSAPTINGYTEGVTALGTVTSTATISISAGTVVTATLTASTACTFTMPPVAAGKSFVLLLTQAAGGSGSATFTSVKWPTAGAPTITTTASKMDILSFVSDGTNWYGSAAQGYTP